jgi:hypothetical protein
MSQAPLYQDRAAKLQELMRRRVSMMRPEVKRMQIQDAFGGLTLTELGPLGLGIYLKIPDFKSACPLCGDAGCAVRHGLYYRLVVDLEGLVIERFPIPRFRCRGKSATFSVLPTALVPRRRFSLPLMLLILDLLRQRLSISKILDHLAESDLGPRGALLVEATTIYRVLAILPRMPLSREAPHSLT